MREATRIETRGAPVVKPVSTARERRIFLTFPWRIYKNDALWVPPLLPQLAKRIDPRRGAFFTRGQAELFIAWRDGRPAGTICAGEDERINRLQGRQECLFGFFECVEDYGVAEAMLHHVKRWAQKRGLNTLFGPFNLDYEDSYGVLIEGRDRPPALLCGHTPPYYRDFFERFGFRQARGDNLAFAIDLEEESPAIRRLSRLADRVRARGRITIRSADRAHWQDEAEHVYHLLNVSLNHLPNHSRIPWQREAVYATLEPFRQVADPDLILFAEVDGDVVGWFPGLPNLNEAFRHANGLRYPWDYLKLGWHMRRQPECLAVKSVLVVPEYWGTGVFVLLADELVKRARAKGYKWADLSLTSDDNPYTPILAERTGARVYKRYRTYRLSI